MVGLGVAQSATVEQGGDLHTGPLGSEGAAGESAGEAGVPAGAAGVAAGDAQARDNRIEDLLTLVLERLPERVAVPAPVVPPVVEAQPRVVVEEELPSYHRMMEQMQRMGTTFFLGGVGPEEANMWRSRLERNFQSCRCPVGYRVDLAVHYLDGDAHLWWTSVVARRGQVELTWGDFVEEFNSKYFPQEAVDRLEARFLSLTQGDRTVREFETEFNRLSIYAGRVMEGEQARVRRFMLGLRPELRTRCLGKLFGTLGELVELAASIEDGLREEVASSTLSFQAKKMQQQSGSSKGSGQVVGQKRKWGGTSGGTQSGPGCFGCGSKDHKIAGCPSRSAGHGGPVRSSQSGQGCFGCGSMDHRVANCPQKGEALPDTRVCFHCKEVGHIKPKCPKLQQGGVAVAPSSRQSAVAPRVYTVEEADERSAGLQMMPTAAPPIRQIAPAPRVYSIAETGEPSSRPITGTF